jgi:predicted ABC-type ATPase
MESLPPGTKKVLIIAGPNGAGKTTFAREFLPREAGVVHFINADLIAAGLSPFQPELAALRAGRLMLEAMETLSRRGESFAFETTLAGRNYVRHIRSWRAQGYIVELVFLSLNSPEAAIARVEERVREGGHFVQPDVVRRRFASGREHFENLYRPLVDHWILFDNMGEVPVMLEWGGCGEQEAP